MSGSISEKFRGCMRESSLRYSSGAIILTGLVSSGRSLFGRSRLAGLEYRRARSGGRMSSRSQDEVELGKAVLSALSQRAFVGAE